MTRHTAKPPDGAPQQIEWEGESMHTLEKGGFAPHIIVRKAGSRDMPTTLDCKRQKGRTCVWGGSGAQTGSVEEGIANVGAYLQENEPQPIMSHFKA